MTVSFSPSPLPHACNAKESLTGNMGKGMKSLVTENHETDQINNDGRPSKLRRAH